MADVNLLNWTFGLYISRMQMKTRSTAIAVAHAHWHPTTPLCTK